VNDEDREWLMFALRWHRLHGGDACSCIACRDHLASKAWAKGEHEQRPPDRVIKRMMR
jgi:hypothetical protein